MGLLPAGSTCAVTPVTARVQPRLDAKKSPASSCETGAFLLCPEEPSVLLGLLLAVGALLVGGLVTFLHLAFLLAAILLGGSGLLGALALGLLALVLHALGLLTLLALGHLVLAAILLGSGLLGALTLSLLTLVLCLSSFGSFGLAVGALLVGRLVTLHAFGLLLLATFFLYLGSGLNGSLSIHSGGSKCHENER